MYSYFIFFSIPAALLTPRDVVVWWFRNVSLFVQKMCAIFNYCFTHDIVGYLTFFRSLEFTFTLLTLIDIVGSWVPVVNLPIQEMCDILIIFHMWYCELLDLYFFKPDCYILLC
jgi:hypothetical protein